MITNRVGSRGRNVTYIAVGALAASLISAVGPGAVPARAAHAPCSQTGIEQTTFLYRYPYSQNAYGSMSTMWSYDRDVTYCLAANTTFVRLGLNYENFVETGLYHRTTSATPVGFTEWSINGNIPNPVLETTTFPNGDWYSFALTPYGSGTSWKAEYDFSGTQTSWTLMEITPTLLTDHGLTESESARFHGQNGRGSYKDLKYRPLSGGWFLWGNIACDTNLTEIDNWDAVITSSSSWYLRAGTPVGGC